MNRWIVPPQVSPTANASSSEYPKVTMRGSVGPLRIDAPAADAACNFTRLGDRHRGAGQAGAGPFDIDHACDSDSFTVESPAVDVVE